jgi:hypothetical protein
MSTDIPVKAKSFEERMKERIKEGIGDLLSDEEVKKLIDRGMEEVFFKPQSSPDPRGYGNNKIKPCLLHEIVKESLQPMVEACVKDYISEHKDEVNLAITTELSKGVGTCMVQAMNNIFMGTMFDFKNQIIQQIQNMPKM